MKQEYQELKDLIETIATTAKLLNYKVDQRDETTFYIHKENNVISPARMVISLSFFSNMLLTSFEKIIVMEYEPHQEKMNHLQYLLQKL